MATKKRKSGGHGGKRPGAGRPSLGNQQLLVRVKPATGKKLKLLAKKLGETPGQWLDTCLSASGSGIIAHKLAILQSEIKDRRRFCLKTAKDLRKEEPARAAQFDYAADGLAEALKMVEDQLELR